MQTLQQERAKFALDHVKKHAIELRNNEAKKEYKSYAASLPAMIHMNGLGQAAAFFKSKGGQHHLLYELLSTWLCGANQPLENHNSMLEGIINEDMQTYRLAQAEAQALMDWVKKFAKVYMTTQESEDDQREDTTNEETAP